MGITDHASDRIRERDIKESDVNMTVQYGQEITGVDGTLYYMGRKQVDDLAKIKIDASTARNLVVVIRKSGGVATVYRSPRAPRQRRMKAPREKRRQAIRHD